MKVVWSEGMFLAPHHLQQWDRHQHAESWGRLQAALGEPWGIAALGFDVAELAGGQVALHRLRAVLPDGTLLDLERTPPPPPRAVPAGRGGQPVEIFLGVAALRERGGNLQEAGTPRSSPARFVAREVEVFDVFSEARPRPVELAHLNLRLFFDDEPAEGFVRIKLAEVLRDASGHWKVSPRYFPPCLRLDAAPGLERALESLQARLVARRRALNQRRLAGGALELTASDVILFWFLHTLNGAVASLDHCLKLGSLPPERAFEVLRACAGQLCTFSEGADPLALPEYQRADLHGCFSALIHALDQLLGSVVPETYVQIPLTRDGTNRWRGTLPEDGALRGARFLLLLAGELPPGVSVSDACAAMKLASGEDIDFIVNAALQGVDLVPLAQPPAGAPRRPDTHYLRVRTRGQFWDTMSRSRQLALHLPGGLARLTPELIALPAGEP
jgi:type VI secretion system protein ImpJ